MCSYTASIAASSQVAFQFVYVNQIVGLHETMVTSICLNTTIIWNSGTTLPLPFIQAVLRAQPFAFLNGNAYFQQFENISIFHPVFLANPWVCQGNETCSYALAVATLNNGTDAEAPSASTPEDGCGIAHVVANALLARLITQDITEN